MARVVFYGDPVSQARCRIFKRGNKVMSFDPQASLKRELKIEAREQLKGIEKFKYPRISF